MIARLPGVYQVQATGATSASAYRSPLIPSVNTNVLTVDAATLSLPATAGTSLAQGEFLNAATAREPACVLGAAAAQLLGIDKVFPGERVWVTGTGANGNGGMWLYVTGILSPDVDSSVLVGFPFAQQYLSFDGHPTTIYLKAAYSQVNAVYNLLGDQANPENPSGVDVSQPSNALVAEADAKSAFSALFLGLGAVALLVGALGVANIMIISVLERRSEIGLRRALGATRGHIRTQFLAEAIALSVLGGAAGIITGIAATAIYAHGKGWATVIPTDAWAGGLAAAISSAPSLGCCPPSVLPACPPPTGWCRTRRPTSAPVAGAAPRRNCPRPDRPRPRTQVQLLRAGQPRRRRHLRRRSSEPDSPFPAAACRRRAARGSHGGTGRGLQVEVSPGEPTHVGSSWPAACLSRRCPC